MELSLDRHYPLEPIEVKDSIIKIEFCGITEQKDLAMTSTGKGVLKEA
jgi:hypothetical protein